MTSKQNQYDLESSSSDEDDNMDSPSGEEYQHEVVVQQFQQEKYYWLFNQEMGFSKRKGLILNQNQSLSPGEYGKMRSINR